MNPEPDPVESLFAVVLGKPAEQRAAFLDQACAGDAALRQRVEALLKAEAEASGGAFLTGPHQWAPTVEASAEGPGTRIGPYKLLQQIGEGGMGVVYMAEQEQPVRRRVALKIIKPGMDSAQVIARFEAERQALAMMDHQNIARVLDAGTTPSGRPYFVMELVHGVPITKFCDDNQLTPRQRLELFVPVCQAIQHAHQKGIIHRDVKPSNVLVTLYDDKPVPKVIDFGVAKAIEQRLTEKTLFTQFGALVGTFEYMSPEQAEMNAFGVDTRSDVYSLGVLLYELLTGTTPLERERLRRAALNEVVRLIREEEAPRPSARLSSSGNLPKIAAARKTEPGRLSKLVQGEIDWIVMKCLEKDRARRYETASALARDVEHYLRDEPVEACPPSAGYRLRKFARKNRGVLTTATAFAALLLIGSGVSIWLAMAARQAEAVADEKRAAADVAQQEADGERNRANREAAQAKTNAGETRRALNRMTVAKGIQLTEEGNFFTALPWLVKPLERGGLTPEEEQVHRIRVACYLRHMPGRPRLRHVLFADPAVSLDVRWRHRATFSADARRALIVLGDLVHVWDVQRGNLLATLHHPSRVTRAQFSPDGTRVLTSNWGVVWTWDAASGRSLGPPIRDWEASLRQPLALLPQSPWQFLGSVGWMADHPSKYHGVDSSLVEFSRDGRRVLFASDLGFRLVDLETHKLIRKWVSGADWFNDHDLSADGQRLLQVRDGQAIAHDTTAGEVASRAIDHGSPVVSFTFSPDGTRALTIGKDGSARVWDARTWKPLVRLRVTDSRRPVFGQFSPDNRLIACWDETFLQIENLAWWDVESGKLVREIPNVGVDLQGFDWRPDGRQLLRASSRGEVTLWDAAADGKMELVLPHFGVIDAVYAPDGRTLMTASGNGVVRIWDLCERDDPFTRQKPEKDDFNTDIQLKTMLSANSYFGFTPSEYEAKTVAGSEKSTWPDLSALKRLLRPGISFDAAALSPDRSRVLTSHNASKEVIGSGGKQEIVGKRLQLWDARTGQPVGDPLESESGINYVAFSPDSRWVVVAGKDKTARLLNARNGEVMGKALMHEDEVLYAAFSPDSELLIACSRGTARLWRTKTGEPVGERLNHGYFVTRAAFSPNGKIVATASLDSTVRLWDAGCGAPLGIVDLKGNYPSDLAFNPDSSLLLIAFAKISNFFGTDQPTNIGIWDVATQQEVIPAIEVEGASAQREPLRIRFQEDGRVAFGFSRRRALDLTPDPRPAGDLVKLAQLYSG